MVAAVALADEAEALVERDRGLVVREDVELELRDADRARPRDRRLEQGAADPAAPVRRVHHQPEVGDVEARRVRVARERHPADDLAVGLGDEDGGVVGAADGAQVAPLVGDAAPLARRDQEAPGLGAHGLGEPHELVGVGRHRPPHGDAAHACTTTPCPPRRESPAAARPPSSRTSTAAAPPK